MFIYFFALCHIRRFVMRSLKFLILLFILFGATALFAGQLTEITAENGWRSLSQISMSPDTAYAFSSRRASGQYDRNSDGRVDLVVADRNRDGMPDYWATDRNFDGRVDDYQYDRNLDGRIDQWEYDVDHDGVSDKIYVDANGDGRAEMYATLNPITRTYTWYGNMTNIQASSQVSFPPLSSVKGYRGGKIGDSD